MQKYLLYNLCLLTWSESCWIGPELLKVTFWNEDRFFFHPWGLWQQQQKKLQNISFILQCTKIGTEIKSLFKNKIYPTILQQGKKFSSDGGGLQDGRAKKICIVRQNCRYKVYAHFLSGATSHGEGGGRDSKLCFVCNSQGLGYINCVTKSMVWFFFLSPSRYIV